MTPAESECTAGPTERRGCGRSPMGFSPGRWWRLRQCGLGEEARWALGVAGGAVNARDERAPDARYQQRQQQQVMAMQKTAPGEVLATGSAGTGRNGAVRVVRHRIRATAAADGARARGTAIRGSGGGPARTERHERRRGEGRRKSVRRREREAAAGLTGAHGAARRRRGAAAAEQILPEKRSRTAELVPEEKMVARQFQRGRDLGEEKGNGETEGRGGMGQPGPAAGTVARRRGLEARRHWSKAEGPMELRLPPDRREKNRTMSEGKENRGEGRKRGRRGNDGVTWASRRLARTGRRRPASSGASAGARDGGGSRGGARQRGGRPSGARGRGRGRWSSAQEGHGRSLRRRASW